VRASLLLLLLAVAACSRASDESEAKRAPKAPPPARVDVPAGLSIAVTIDGVAAAPLTAARLTSVPPDFQDEERRAWKVARLIPEADRVGATIEARGAGGVAIKVPRPSTDAEPQPVLMLTRRGDVIVSLVDPANPFPPYHGQGGQLRRPGDTQPRLSAVTTISITMK
jgi:hypothetical protein